MTQTGSLELNVLSVQSHSIHGLKCFSVLQRFSKMGLNTH